jgi:radical SAM superfamily enzyme YgiQ (UPF0313 family)
MHKIKIGRYVRSMREAPLTLASLAALAPDDIDIQFELIDGSIDHIPLNSNPDLVGISAITGTANEAYRIAEHFRSRKIPVVLGGVHPTIMPEEAKQHADSIVIGMAEKTWPQLLRDFANNSLKPRYEIDDSDEQWLNVPSPRMDLIRRSGYMIPNSIQATRGCSKTCDFCSVPTIWNRFQKRPVGDVIDDIKKVKGRFIGFGDVNLIDDIEYAKELFAGLIPLKKKWGGLATTEVTRDAELFDLMVKSGCKFLLIGFESINQPSLNAIAKGFNQDSEYKEVINQLHSAGISVQGCFVFGFDHDDQSVFKDTVERVQQLKIDIPRYSIYTPYPGTRLFSRLMNEKRMLSFNWNDYDTMHVVFQPKQMSCDQLYNGFKWAYRETFKLHHIIHRTASVNLSCPINFVGNLAYRIFVKRLYRDQRFALPYSECQANAVTALEKEKVTSCLT